MADLEERIREMAEGVAGSLGLEVQEIKLLGRGRKMLLRVTIDKPGGVTLGDCAAVSRDLSALLDVEDPIRASYTLEVSSPGLDRPLRNKRDFEKNTGRLVRIATKEKVAGRNAFMGRVVSAGESSVVVSIEETEIEIPYEIIASAKVEIEIKK